MHKLTANQQELLRFAHNEPEDLRTATIEAATQTVRRLNSKAFYKQVVSNSKPDPALKDRVFFDQPHSLRLGIDYSGHVHNSLFGTKQAAVFKARDAKLLKGK